METVSLRRATADDIYFISAGFHAAMLIENPTEEQVRKFAEKVCAVPGVLYSPENTTIAVLDGKPAGMLTAYVGAEYAAMRKKTFQVIKEEMGLEFENMEDETRGGEYYLDSCAVLPEYRGRGIGSLLIKQGIKDGKLLGLTVTLAVDPVNLKAQKLYSSLGFQRDGKMFIFGHDYWRMKI